MHHPTQVLIHTKAYEENIRTIRSQLPASCRLCAVVKADAYGHGLSSLAPAALHAGADALGITDNWEAECIRRLNLRCPLLRLRPATPEEAQEAAAWEVEEIIGSYDAARIYSQWGQEREKPIPIHLKLDIGVNRMSFSFPHQREIIEQVCRMKGLDIRGVMTHFPVSDDEDLAPTQAQCRRFEQETRQLLNLLPPTALFHAANSAAALRLPDSRHSMVRMGIALYGIKPSPCVEIPGALQPVMSWKTTILLLREVPEGSTIGYGMTYRADRRQRIATLPVGYADGYLRELSNRADVLIRGIRCPVVGRVSMDMITVNVSHLPEVAVGDEVVLLGRQGSETITAEELARRAGTIAYEITCLAGKCASSRIVLDGRS